MRTTSDRKIGIKSPDIDHNVGNTRHWAFANVFEMNNNSICQPTMESPMFVCKEVIGETKVNVTQESVDVLALARAIADAKTAADTDDAFMIVNLDAVNERVQLWRRELPHVQPFYAVKCNPDVTMLRTLAALDVGFDCASREEIEMVLRVGVPADRIIYANTCKSRAYIEHASVQGVSLMTFDNAEDLEKIVRYHQQPKVILRIAAYDETATRPLNLKFGADPIKVAPGLLERAAELDVNIVGLPLHVGSGCNDPMAFRAALKHTRTLVDIGRALGHKMDVVDVGGGFPGGDFHAPFEQFAAIIRSALGEFFPEPADMRFIAEPGRFFAARPFTLVIARTTIGADKITKNAADAGAVGRMYYANDGLFGSFNCKMIDHVHPIGRPLFDEVGELYPSTIWGPTCDSQDKIEENKLMRELRVGDWLLYEEMGAYTCAASTTFNGFPRPDKIYVVAERTWHGKCSDCDEFEQDTTLCIQ